MNWLIPALITTSSMAMLFALINLFLYFQDKDKFLMLWSISWATYSLRFIIHIYIVLKILPSWFVIFQQLTSLVSAFIFIVGTYFFLKRPFPKFWLYGTALCFFWVIFSEIYSLSFQVAHIPSSFFIGFVFCWTGYLLIKNKDIDGDGKHITGWAFILWGIHKADYPFLRPILWFAPWGYLLASVLFFISAIGMFLVYFEKIKTTLKVELQERKKISEVLQASEAELTAIIENSALGITISDLNGNILRSNPAHQEMFGYNLNELSKMSFSDFTLSDDIGKHKTFYEKMIAGEIDHFNMQKRFTHKDGHTVWGQVTLSLVHDQDRKPKFVVGLVEDITLRKLDEDKKNSLIKELQIALDEIKTLYGIIPICMYCKKIRSEKGAWDKLEAYLTEHTHAELSHGLCPDCLKIQMDELDNEE